MEQHYILYDYFRSSASYRVRIALELKKLDYQQIPVDLRIHEQKSSDYLTRNPQGLVPSLAKGNILLTQSMAILEYLEELYPSPPLLPKDLVARAHIRAFALVIACDIHPLNNLRILNYLKTKHHLSEEAKNIWYHHWLEEGFEALEATLSKDDNPAPFCFGQSPSLADICLIPQIYNAQRFNFSLNAYPRCLSIYNNALEIDAFQKAAPESQITTNR